MNIDVFMQIVSIVGNCFVIMLLWDRMHQMPYSFWHILVRASFYRDFDPFDWLISNLEYLGFLMVFIGHSFTMVGLLQQFGLDQIHTKPQSFFVSSPMNNLGIVLIIYIYAMRNSNAPVKKNYNH